MTCSHTCLLMSGYIPLRKIRKYWMQYKKIAVHLKILHKVCCGYKLAVLRVQWISSWLMQALYHQNDMAEEVPERIGSCEKRKINN